MLYAHPSAPAETEALRAIQSALQSALPSCSEQQRQGVFTPHLTIAHFASRDAAEEAKAALLLDWTPVTFRCDEAIHLMRRLGGSGQFERACTLRFGDLPPLLFEPPQRFEAMLQEEEEWMRQARRDSYKRGRGGSGAGRKRGRGRPRRSPEERAAIAARTPEEIAQIRAERAAKKERLAAAEARES